MYCSCSGSRSFSFSLDGDLYAGTSVDFMGANAAIFRTSIQGSSQHYIRTEAYDHNWLNGKKLRFFCYPFDTPDKLLQHMETLTG